MKKLRPTKHEHFFNRARVVAERSTCIRRKVGAIIVNEDGVELSSGYSGAPRKTKHCISMGNCIRITLEIPSGQHYELCRSVHAEQNAIINAARTGISIVNGQMYISSQKSADGYDKNDQNGRIYGPCLICKKEIINAGIKKVHMREEGVGVRCYTLDQIRKLLTQEEEERRNTYRQPKSPTKQTEQNLHLSEKP